MVLEYLVGTKNMKVTLEVGDLSITNWFIDASYQVRNYRKKHLGG